MVVKASSRFRHRAHDLGVFPPRSGLAALPPFVGALQALALALRGRSLPRVRTPLSRVGRFLAIVGDSVPLIGKAFSLVGDALAPRKLALTPRESVLALIQLSSAAIGFVRRVSTVCGDHASP